jgi:hypothetical protein
VQVHARVRSWDLGLGTWDLGARRRKGGKVPKVPKVEWSGVEWSGVVLTVLTVLSVVREVK